MNEWTIVTESPEETMNLAARLGNLVQAGDVITLEGDLGAGKTCFTKGLAKGLGITRVVNSPTFTIIKEYMGRIPLYHMDAYRLESEDEDFGFDEYFYGNGLSVVEWPSMILSQLPDDRLEIHIYHLDETSRKMVFTSTGERSLALWKGLQS